MQHNELIGGRYRVIRELGRGGMGVVYEALQEDLRRPVAIKVLRTTAPGASQGAHERFLREARAAASLSSPHVVQILDFGTDPTPYLVMELLVGATLAQRHARERLGERDVLAYARQVLLALELAHAQGIIHRDIKPANLFQVGGDRGTWKLLDFGVAKLTHATHALTAEGSMLGTVAYMAPELFSDPNFVHPGIDIYALGVCMFESLTGRRPTSRTDFAGILAELETQSAPTLRSLAPNVSPALAELIDRAAARDPRIRFDSARAMLSALDQLEQRLSQAAPALTSAAVLAGGAARPRSSWPWALGGAALLLAVGAGVAAGIYQVASGNAADAQAAEARNDIDAGLAAPMGVVPGAVLAAVPSAAPTTPGAPSAASRTVKGDAGASSRRKVGESCATSAECGAPGRCVDRVCQCGAMQTRTCGGFCASVDDDQCTACGKACPTDQHCVLASAEDFNPTCVACKSDQALDPVVHCGAPHQCVHLKSSDEHCGKCGNTCAAGSKCQQGICVVMSTLHGPCQTNANCPLKKDSSLRLVCRQGRCECWDNEVESEGVCVPKH